MFVSIARITTNKSTSTAYDADSVQEFLRFLWRTVEIIRETHLLQAKVHQDVVQHVTILSQRQVTLGKHS